MNEAEYLDDSYDYNLCGKCLCDIKGERFHDKKYGTICASCFYELGEAPQED